MAEDKGTKDKGSTGGVTNPKTGKHYDAGETIKGKDSGREYTVNENGTLSSGGKTYYFTEKGTISSKNPNASNSENGKNTTTTTTENSNKPPINNSDYAALMAQGQQQSQSIQQGTYQFNGSQYQNVYNGLEDSKQKSNDISTQMTTMMSTMDQSSQEYKDMAAMQEKVNEAAKAAEFLQERMKYAYETTLAADGAVNKIVMTLDSDKLKITATGKEGTKTTYDSSVQSLRGKEGSDNNSYVSFVNNNIIIEDAKQHRYTEEEMQKIHQEGTDGTYTTGDVLNSYDVKNNLNSCYSTTDYALYAKNNGGIESIFAYCKEKGITEEDMSAIMDDYIKLKSTKSSKFVFDKEGFMEQYLSSLPTKTKVTVKHKNGYETIEADQTVISDFDEFAEGGGTYILGQSAGGGTAGADRTSCYTDSCAVAENLSVYKQYEKEKKNGTYTGSWTDYYATHQNSKPNTDALTSHADYSRTEEKTWEDVKKQLDAGKTVILHVQSKTHSTHWVAVTGYSGECQGISDLVFYDNYDYGGYLLGQKDKNGDTNGTTADDGKSVLMGNQTYMGAGQGLVWSMNDDHDYRVVD